jgi:MrcB-like, N-terminal domain/Domain of unknown function (DUF3883)
MPSADDLATILTAAAYYSIETSAEMEEREAALRRFANTLRAWLMVPPDATTGDTMRLEVKAGGRQALLAPVPWVRIFSRRHSPRTTEGFYVVYLFAGDGSCVYLSLNQGTSEFRSGKMRPIREPEVIQAQAAEARSRFEGWAHPLIRQALTSIDLAVDELAVGAESKQRAHNYEAGNVFAIRYEGDALPGETALQTDLFDMVDLLIHLYEGGGPAGAGGAAVDTSATRERRGQRRVADLRVRKAIEDRAMAVVMRYFADEGGWTVEDVSRFRPYDLVCRREDDGAEIHVEVKGTTTSGEQILLTRNEVAHARDFSHPVLAIVSEINLSDEGEGVGASGGRLSLHNPWVIDDAALVPTQFIYSLRADLRAAEPQPLTVTQG